MTGKPKQSGKAKATKAAQADIIVAEWKKNAKEVVRVMLQVYRGKLDISIRAWYRDRGGELLAGRQGITLSIAKYLPKVSKALKQARKLAKTFPASASKSKGGR